MAHLAKVLAKSEHYREKWKGLPVEDWRNFPTIDKAEMMAEFDALNTVGVRKVEALEVARKAEVSRDFSPQIGDVTVGLSSGTSGTTGLFLASPEERAEWAGNILAKVLPFSILRPQKIALFLRANSRLYEATRSKRIRFEFFDLLDPVGAHLDRFNRFQPDVVVAPPSMLRILANARRRGDIQASPRKVVSAAETLDQLDAILVSSAFERRVHEIYQCTEGFLAATCAEGTLHVNEDIVVIQKEYIDERQGRFIPLITDFRRISQPVIRYRLDDILVERRGAPCECGSTWMALEQIEGRCDDLCFLRVDESAKMAMQSRGPWIPLFPDFLRRAVIGADDRIEDFAISQRTENSFAVSFFATAGSPRNRIQGAILDALTARAESMGGVAPNVVFVEMPKFPMEVKRRRVSRECELPEDLKRLGGK